MDTLLQDIPNVICYIDDILISGKDQESHLQSLGEVFKRLEAHGIRLKQEKCEFLLSSVEYLGHQISQDGIQPLHSKVEPIVNAPVPKNVQELRSFLGLLNYYGKFIPSLATILHPLNSLLRTGVKWAWTKQCEEAFNTAKSHLTSAKVLTHYDPALPLALAADASAYGTGAVISHVLPDGSERPIAFASRILTASEKNYAQLEKEAQSLIFGIKKFHQYLYGRRFTLITNHKPLTTILGPKKAIPSLAAARLQRWAVLLLAYTYDIQYKSTHTHCNADGLSRLPLPILESAPVVDAVSIFNMAQVHALPVTFQDIRTATRKDKVLSKVLTYVQRGWPAQVSEDLKPFNSRKQELTIESGCLMWGIRVIVPQQLQSKLLKSLHENHPGSKCMKAMAQSYFWWGGLDKAIENLARSCQSCQAIQPKPSVAPLHPWIWPDIPWKRIHVDFTGPFMDKIFFVVIDAHSKWPEQVMMSHTTSLKTIEALRSFFSQFGLPEQLVSDNGPQFTSTEFSQFMKGNHIKHIRSSPYHPSSNGLAERFVQTFKRAMKATEHDGRSLQHRPSEFLLNYRATEHATTNTTPSELFLNWRLRTRFDFLKPDTQSHVESQQASQKERHDQHAKLRCLFPGSPVMAKDFRRSNTWVPGTVLRKLGPLTYSVDVGNCKIWKRHIDHLHHRPEPTVTQPIDTPILDNGTDSPTPQLAEEPETPVPDPVPGRRYPSREHHPPDRLMQVFH